MAEVKETRGGTRRGAGRPRGGGGVYVPLSKGLRSRLVKWALFESKSDPLGRRVEPRFLAAELISEALDARAAKVSSAAPPATV